MSNDGTGRQLIPSIDIKMTPLLSACLYLMLIFCLVGNTALQADSGFGKVQFKNRFVGAFETEQEQYQVNNWADFSYRYNAWRSGLRFEYHDPKNSGLYNERVTQRFIEFKHDWIRVKAGNFYEKLGRGLIFHAYEIQSDALDRTDINIAIDRNIDGVNLKLLFDKVELTGIWGKPLRFLSSERGEPLGGGEIQLRPLESILLGAAALRFQSENFRGESFLTDIGSLQTGITLGNLDLFGEFAQKRSENTISEPDGSAFYTSASYAGAGYGIAAEYKRYRHFATIFNNPPTLVKTHSFVLLNRHTHTLLADDETGTQLEAFFSPVKNTTITLHASGADGIGTSRQRQFREFFIKSRIEWLQRFIFRGLIDYSRDQVIGDLNRWTGAFDFDVVVGELNSILLDGQLQHIENRIDGKYWNSLALLGFSRSPWLSISAQYEHTTNPFSRRKDWLTTALNLKIGQQHDFILTAGARPAGLVCSGGVCFQVSEFSGMELRWTFRY